MIEMYSKEIVVVNGIFIALSTVTSISQLYVSGTEGYGDVRWVFTVKSAFNDVTIVAKDEVEYYSKKGIEKEQEYGSKKQKHSEIHAELIRIWNDYLEGEND